jgi:hypothetical protein
MPNFEKIHTNSEHYLPLLFSMPHSFCLPTYLSVLFFLNLENEAIIIAKITGVRVLLLVEGHSVDEV